MSKSALSPTEKTYMEIKEVLHKQKGQRLARLILRDRLINSNNKTAFAAAMIDILTEDMNVTN